MNQYNVIILGAGASGLMAAICAGKNGKKVLIVDHAQKAGKKILVSGGGKCNVTNRKISTFDYYGENPDFCQNALQNFTTKDSLQMLKKAGIEIEERECGRIFCKQNADMLASFLVKTAQNQEVNFLLGSSIEDVRQNKDFFEVQCKGIQYKSPHLLIATGSPAWPQIGATDIGCKLAKQFGHRIISLKPVLTGFILESGSSLLNLQGISLNIQAKIQGDNRIIEEPILFTHKGLSGPSMLQLSCFWEKGDIIVINFLPEGNASLLMHEPQNGKLLVKNLFTRFLPERLIYSIIPEELLHRKVAELGKKDRQRIINNIHAFEEIPKSIEGFSKAEASRGGVDTLQINSKTMESLIVPGLFFSGEVIDITGKLGGYNIHWAFASGFTAGQFL